MFKRVSILRNSRPNLLGLEDTFHYSIQEIEPFPVSYRLINQLEGSLLKSMGSSFIVNLLSSTLQSRLF
jgi:hypothetical protein